MARLLRSGLVAALVALAALGAGQAAAGGGHIVYLSVLFKGQADFIYGLQPGSPTYLANFLNMSGCNWFGFVGRAFGQDGNPVVNLTVHLEGGGVNLDVVTGSGPLALGPGSYQIPVGDRPVATSGVYFIQLRDNSDTALSDTYMIPTYGDCERNLVLVNFAFRR